MYKAILRNALNHLEGAPLPHVPSNVPNKSSNYLSMKIQMKTKAEPLVMDRYLDAISVLFSKELGCKVGRVIGYRPEMKRWSILRSPFIHKVSFKQYETKTSKRCLNIYGLSHTLHKQMCWYVLKNCPADIATTFTCLNYVSSADEQRARVD